MKSTLTIDLHQLELRFAIGRVHDPKRVTHLAQSISQQGQLIPVVVVSEGSSRPGQWVLIDGYCRFEALQELGQDRICIDVWNCSVDEAVLLFLARGSERGLEAIEEAALLHGLCERFSMRELARRIRRDVSWVSRRLKLFRELPQDLLDAVRHGKLSVWAATRVMAPLARANIDHASTLLSELDKTPLSTRELDQLFCVYQASPKIQRERLIANPGLFIKTLDECEQAKQDNLLAAGPEGAWCKDLQITKSILKRLIKLAPKLFSSQQKPLEKKQLQQYYDQTRTQFQRLGQIVEQEVDHD